MMRFGITGDHLVRHGPDPAIAFLWTGSGQATISAVGLTRDGTSLVIPFDTTFLMMGYTPELTAELTAVQGTGITSFLAKAPSGVDAARAKLAARRTTAEGGSKLAIGHTVTVIALHAAATSFHGQWQGILQQGLGSRRATIADLLAELPLIKDGF